jgi:hypothetical protein
MTVDERTFDVDQALECRVLAILSHTRPSKAENNAHNYTNQ